MVITVLLIILGIALVFVFINRHKDEEKARLAIVVITVVAIILAVGSLFMRNADPEVTYDPTVDDALAQVAAARIAQHAEGRRLVIIAELQQPTMMAQTRLATFQVAVETHGMEVLGVEPARPGEEVEEGVFVITEAGLGVDAIQNALQNHPNVEVLVSLSGMPGEGIVRMQRQLRDVEFYAIDEQPMPGWTVLIDRQFLKGGIVPALDGDWTDFSGSREEIFERRYVFVTRENVEEVRSRVEF